MSKTFVPSPATPGVLTANDLRDGRCVWMAGCEWTTDARAATLFDDPARAELALLDAQSQGHLVIDAYLVAALRTDTGPAPAHFREAFRQRGPSTEPAAREVSHA